MCLPHFFSLRSVTDGYWCHVVGPCLENWNFVELFCDANSTGTAGGESFGKFNWLTSQSDVIKGVISAYQ